MKKRFFKTCIFSFIFAVSCFCFTACGNQQNEYNADETVNDTGDNTQSINNETTEDMNSQENAGESIVDGAEDLLDGNHTESENKDQNSTNNSDSKENNQKNGQS